MEIIKKDFSRTPVKAVLFDFDGTISTLRCGWEEVMAPLMEETILACGKDTEAEVKQLVSDWIDESTGIQTIFQMKWLAEQVAKRGGNALDPWDYKDEYNTRLMRRIEEKKKALQAGERNPEEYLMAGAVAFLKALKTKGVALYVASGTDHPDVVQEAKALGVYDLFDELRGAPPHEENCSKEAVLGALIRDHGLKGDEVAVVGDGKVEIRLGKENGCKTIGLASDELRRMGVNPVKRERLIAAGADVITGDFVELHTILNFLGLEEKPSMEYRELDFSGIKTYPAAIRTNLVRIDTMLNPGEHHAEKVNDPDFDILIDRIIEARKNNRPVIWSQGAHVIKNNLSRYLIELMKMGIITHISGNGACSIHDFELAYLGGTSEHVPTAIEDGSFGMWEETGRWMNEAIQEGAKNGWGYGESLARYIDANPARFPYREDCVLYQAYKLGIPATYHIALGTDIIHQHPICDFEAIGKTTGVDFRRYCYSVSQLDGGVFLNFGSAVIGAEVFLKALSIARNLGYPTFKITTANFDLIDLGDYRVNIGYEDPNYYYRPRKNIVNRPVSRGGLGWHFCLDHQVSIPNLYDALIEKGFTK